MQIFGVIFLLIGVVILFSAGSAIHEIEAFIVWLIGTVLLCAGSIIGAIERIRQEILDRWPEKHDGTNHGDHLFQVPDTSRRWAAIRNRLVMGGLIFLALAIISSGDRLGAVLSKLFGNGAQSQAK